MNERQLIGNLTAIVDLALCRCQKRRNGIAIGRYIVDANDVHLLLSQRDGNANCAKQPLVDCSASHLLEEPLARMPDQDRATEFLEITDRRQDLHVVLGGLAESHSRIEGNPLGIDTSAGQRLQALGEDEFA